MGAPLAFLICGSGIAGLFFLNRDNAARNFVALWLPVVWVGIAGSRPVSAWLETGTVSANTLDATLEGSPTDAAIYAALLALGVLVLLGRRKRTGALLAGSGLLIVYFLYCLVSVSWSPIPGPAFKRWIKAVGDLVMVLIVATDAQPVTALRRLYSRLGFILFPLSVVLIRYTDMGRGYTPDGEPMNTGVTLNKNSLGLIVFVISLGALWNVRSLLNHKDESHRNQRLVAQTALLAFGLALLQMAHSATSIACFILGSVLILAPGLRAIKNRPARMHSLCALIVLAGGLTFLAGGDAYVVHALGRQDNLSGRTEIWRACLASAGDPVIGAGFESFWNTNGGKVALYLKEFWHLEDLVSAHNGYLEVYLDLGWIGVCLIALILINGYRRACRATQLDLELGSLFLAYVATVAIYGITEAGFRVLQPSWIFLLLAVVCANAVSAGFFTEKIDEPAAQLAAGMVP